MKTPSARSTRAGDELGPYVGWVRRMANALVRDGDAADDIAQEALIVALKRGPDPGNPIRPWLGGVLRNVLMHHHRARGRRRNYELATKDLDAGAPAPDEVLETVQLQRKLMDMLDGLSEPIRTTLMLRYYHGMSSADIARKLGLPASTVRSRLAMGLDLLRKRFDELHDGDREAWKRILLPFAAAAPTAGLGAGPTAGAFYAAAAALLVAGVFLLSPQTRLGAAAWDRITSKQGTTDRAKTKATALAGVTSSSVTGRAAQVSETQDVAAMLTGPDVAGPQRWANRQCEENLGGLLGPEVGGARPRLLVTPQRLCQLRAAREAPDSMLREITALLHERVEARQPHLFTVEHLSYARASEAQAASFMFLLGGERRHAQQAYEAIEAIYRDGGDDFTPEKGHGLARARTGMALALTYDWAYHGLDDRQRAQLARWLDGALDGWSNFSHPNLMGDEASYWVAMCRGTELLQLLALGAEKTRAERFFQVRSSLKSHVANAYGTFGMGEEGIAHVARGGLHLLVAAYALRSVGFDELESAVRAQSFWKLAMFAGSSTLTNAAPRRARILQSGVSPRVADETGWASLLFRLVPAQDLGLYRHFYDRHMGRASPRVRGERFDSHAAGWVWSALYLPEQVVPQDPTPTLGRTLADPQHGAYFFRRSWSELSDVQVMVLGDYRSHGRGWDVDEAFGLGIVAHGVSFAGGGGPSLKRGWPSGLFVDGRPYSGGRDVGSPDRYEATTAGGYVVVDGGSKYERLGLSSSKRHVRVDLGQGAAPVIVSTLDVLRASSPHDYAWQLNPGDHSTDDGISVVRGDEAGRQTFIMTAPNGAYLKGWVMHPASAAVVAGDPLKVQLRSADADLWIVMAVGRGTPPVALSRGEGLRGGGLRIADADVRFDAGASRIVVERR